MPTTVTHLYMLFKCETRYTHTLTIDDDAFIQYVHEIK